MGQRFGKLRVVSGGDTRGRMYCQCDCGRRCHVQIGQLDNGGRTDCGRCNQTDGAPRQQHLARRTQVDRRCATCDVALEDVGRTAKLCTRCRTKAMADAGRQSSVRESSRPVVIKTTGTFPAPMPDYFARTPLPAHRPVSAVSTCQRVALLDCDHIAVYGDVAPIPGDLVLCLQDCERRKVVEVIKINSAQVPEPRGKKTKIAPVWGLDYKLPRRLSPAAVAVLRDAVGYVPGRDYEAQDADVSDVDPST